MDKVLIGLGIFVLVIGILCGTCFLLNENNAKEMAEYIDTFKVDTNSSLDPKKDELGNWYFTTDDDFKVLHLTDIHITGGFANKEQDKKAINAVAAMVSSEKPDLVIVTGDISFAIPNTGTINNKYAHEMFIRLMENLGVYWTVTFGNHDDESFNYYRRQAVADMYAENANEKCLFMQSPDGVSGMGNHVINVKNSIGEVTKSLIMIDTHAYIHTGLIGGTIDSIFWRYDCVKQDQVDWYANIIDIYKPKSSLMFFHIPLIEVKNAYDEYVANGRTDTENVKWLFGVDGEDRADEVVFSSRLENQQLFNKVLELGNTKAMFFGHDHLNNFVLDYKGIMLSYGYSIDYSAYSDIDESGLQRGCTILTLTPDGKFNVKNIVHENYYQDKYQPLYEKETVDMTPYYEQ